MSQIFGASAQPPSDGPPPQAAPAPRTNIASAAALVMIFFVLSRITGLAREIIIGAQFGTGADLDAYLAAFRLPDLFFQVVAGGALGSAFIPTFAAYWVGGAQGGAWLLFSRVLNAITLLLVLLAALGALFALPLVRHLIAPGFSAEQQELTASLMRIMLAGSVVFGASGLIMGALNAVQHFLLPAAAPVVYNLAIIVGAAALGPLVGVYGLAAGVVVGSSLHLLVQVPALLRYGARYTPSLTLRDAGVREVVRLMGPRVLGLLFVQMHFLINTILASSLSGGSLSALNYAWLLMLLPQGIFAQAIATAAFPTFAAQIAAGQAGAMRATFGQTLRTVLFLVIPAAAGLYVLRVPLIRSLWERGLFDSGSTQLVAYALQFYALGLIAHAALEIIVRAFYALHDTATPVAVGIGAMVLNILLSLWLVGWLSFGGLALANSVATTLEMALLLWLLRRRLGGIDGSLLAWSAGRSVLAAAIMVAALHLLLAGAAQAGLANPYLLTFAGLVTAAAVYGAAAALLRHPELQPALRLVTRRLRRTAP